MMRVIVGWHEMEFAETKNKTSASSGNIVAVSSKQPPNEELGRENDESGGAVCC